MKAVGATEAEKLQAVAALQSGATFDQVVQRFSHVEEDYWLGVKDELFTSAGIDTRKKPAKG